MFIWELGYDVPANQSNSLLKAIYDVMPHVSGPTLVCNTTTPFTLQNLPNGGTISWSRSNNLTHVSGQGSQYNVKAASSSTSGTGWVQATINGPCDTVQLPRYDVWVGLPGNFTTSPASIIYQPYNTLFGVILHPASPSDQAIYLWNTYGGVFLAGDNTGENISFFSSSFDDCGFIDITAQNSCGVRQGPYNSTITLITGFGGCGGIELPMSQENKKWSVRISPNPAQDYIDIEIMYDNKPVPFDLSNHFHLSIYNTNKLSDPIETIKSTSPAKRIPVKHLNTGNYALSVIISNEIRITGKFIIKK